MGSHKAAVSLMRCVLVRAVAVLWALAQPTGASAQYPTDLHRCLDGGFPGWPTGCVDVEGALLIDFCSEDPPVARYYSQWFGRLAFFPLQCAGPITVAVETASRTSNRFPLYVEVVPIPNDSREWYRICEDLPGYVVQIVYGHFGVPCGVWDEVGPVDITTVIPVGSLYALQLRSFGSATGYSPGVNCVRVTAQPVDNTPVASTTWGLVKALYR